MDHCRHDALRVHGAHRVGRHLPRQGGPIAARDVHHDGAVPGQLLGAEQLHDLVGGAAVNLVFDRASILGREHLSMRLVFNRSSSDHLFHLLAECLRLL